jgi:hypothetical protein
MNTKKATADCSQHRVEVGSQQTKQQKNRQVNMTWRFFLSKFQISQFYCVTILYTNLA